MNIELTALEAGSLVIFSIAVTGIVMSLRKRVIRNKKKEWQKEKTKIVEKTEFKINPETQAPENVVKQPENTESSQEHASKNTEQPTKKPDVDVDALLKDLKEKSDNQ